MSQSSFRGILTLGLVLGLGGVHTACNEASFQSARAVEEKAATAESGDATGTHGSIDRWYDGVFRSGASRRGNFRAGDQQKTRHHHQ